MRRNRLLLGAAALILIAVGGGTTAALQQATRAELQAERAAQATQFMASLFDAANPFGDWQEAQTLDDVLETAQQRAEAELASAPKVLAEVQTLIGQALLGRGEYAKAVEALSAALARTEAEYGHDSQEAAQAHNQLAHALVESGNYTDAAEHAQRAHGLFEKAGASASISRSDALTNLAVAVSNLGDKARARTLHESALTLREAELPADHPSIADSKMSLAAVLAALGKLDRVLKLNQEALRSYQQHFGSSHPMTLRAHNGVASSAFLAGDYESAATAFQQLVADARERLGADHPELALLYNNLGRSLVETGDFLAAQAAYEYALARVTDAPEQRMLSISVRLNRAALGVELGAFKQALPELQRAAQALQTAVGADHPLGYRAAVQFATAQTLADQPGAVSTLEALVDDPRAASQPEWQARARLALARNRSRNERSVAAKTLLDAATPILRAAWRPTSWRAGELELHNAIATQDAAALQASVHRLAAALPAESIRRQRAIEHLAGRDHSNSLVPDTGAP